MKRLEVEEEYRSKPHWAPISPQSEWQRSRKQASVGEHEEGTCTLLVQMLLSEATVECGVTNTQRTKELYCHMAWLYPALVHITKRPSQ